MAKIISCLLNNTALKLNKILNKILKTYKLLITFWLADITKANFIISYYLKLKRAITIIILYKKSKVDYLFLKNYCPIVLKNTLSKILKNVIIKYIANIAKKNMPYYCKAK